MNRRAFLCLPALAVVPLVPALPLPLPRRSWIDQKCEVEAIKQAVRAGFMSVNDVRRTETA